MIKFNAQKLAAVAMAQSTEQARYYLNGVFFCNGQAIATNGHILMVADDDNSETTTDGVIMPISKKAITAMKGKKAETVEIDNDLLTVKDYNGETLYIEPCKEIDGTYPDWQRVMVEPSNCCHGAFANEYMRLIGDIGKILSSGVKISGEDEGGPHHLKFNRDDVQGAIMPIRW